MMANKILPLTQQRRAVSEILLDLMKIVNKHPTSVTRLMYAANLSWKPLQRYMAHLINIRYIEEVGVEGKPHRCAYTITDKGRNFVQGMGKFEKEITFVSSLVDDNP